MGLPREGVGEAGGGGDGSTNKDKSHARRGANLRDLFCVHRPTSLPNAIKKRDAAAMKLPVLFVICDMWYCGNLCIAEGSA